MTSSVTRCFLFAVLWTGFPAAESSAQQRQGTRIIDVETDEPSNDLVVKVSGKGTVWVGLTIYPGREIDLDPVRIWPELPGIAIARFSRAELAAHLSESNLQGGFNYVVALWRERISLAACRSRYGKDSEQCARAERNGFQLEGRLDEREGKYP